MEGIVAKRTLKKSYYDNNKIKTLDIGITNNVTKNKENTKDKKAQNIFSKFKANLLFKLSLQTVTMASIVAFVLAVKFLGINIVSESEIAKKIIAEYAKTYSLEQVHSAVKVITEKIYIYIKPIVPDEIENKVKGVYKNIIQKKVNEDINQDIPVTNNEVEIYEESSVNNKVKSEKENIGVSVDEEIVVVTAASAISSEQDIASRIKQSGIVFTKPVNGVITSTFGAREVIFEGVDSYHTGTDIAAKKGTKVVSSTDGKVTVATYNKYNGNYVEVTNGKITTKYCHLSKISVSKGESIKAGEKVGEVGSTGLSTGPHLHFEVVYDGVKVNPELILKL